MRTNKKKSWAGQVGQKKKSLGVIEIKMLRGSP